MKYRLSIEDHVEGISMSRCLDDIVVIHVNYNNAGAAASNAASASAATEDDNDDDNFFQHNCISCSADHHHHHDNQDNDNNTDDDDQEQEDNTQQSSSSGCLLHNNHHVNTGTNKGDVILHTCHAVEMVTKIFLVHKNIVLASKNKARQEQQHRNLLPIHFSNQ